MRSNIKHLDVGIEAGDLTATSVVLVCCFFSFSQHKDGHRLMQIQSSQVHDLKALFRLMDLQRRRPGEVDRGRRRMFSAAKTFRVSGQSWSGPGGGQRGMRVGKIVLGRV